MARLGGIVLRETTDACSREAGRTGRIPRVRREVATRFFHTKYNKQKKNKHPGRFADPGEHYGYPRRRQPVTGSTDTKTHPPDHRLHPEGNTRRHRTTQKARLGAK